MPAKRVLFTTPYTENYYDYFRENCSPNVDHLVYPRINSYGLRFLKQNVPGLTIMEYPTWDQYAEIVSEDWDIVGFSFFTPDYPKVEKMASLARQKGVPHLWGGSYGSLIPEANRLFDKTIIGYAERTIAEILGHEVTDLVHPPIVDAIGVTNQMHLARTGILFTSRGCPFKCTFCQTPVFCGGVRELLPLDSIRRALSYYKSIKVPLLLILDETFGLSNRHSKKVVEMLRDYGLPWIPMTRIDILHKNLDHWLDCGMAGAMLGVENLQQQNIHNIQKEIKIKTAFNVIDRLLHKGRLVIGFYMIGFENETVSSIQKDILWLANLGLDLVQVCVLTPLHGTPLLDDIQKKYGKLDPDLTQHTAKNLVWNHPAISKNEIAELLTWSYEILYPSYQLEYSESKYFNPRQLGVDACLTSADLSTVTLFDHDHLIQEPRLSPCRLTGEFLSPAS